MTLDEWALWRSTIGLMVDLYEILQNPGWPIPRVVECLSKLHLMGTPPSNAIRPYDSPKAGGTRADDMIVSRNRIPFSGCVTSTGDRCMASWSTRNKLEVEKHKVSLVHVK